MKRCGRCGEDKPHSEFGKHSSKKDGLQSLCSTCNKSQNKEWYEINRRVKIARTKEFRRVNIAWLREYKKTLKCARCPENHPRCLDFHHVADKDKAISEAVRDYSLDRLKLEIAKCEVLCANCHRKETFADDES